ncbi:MAG: TonB-dependent receptor [Thermomonas sp.]|uniref:TonB-dependent receptor n=1 Tax=Thermomonas sp. TaxID=1971895 RepID=UPI0039E26F68
MRTKLLRTALCIGIGMALVPAGAAMAQEKTTEQAATGEQQKPAAEGEKVSDLDRVVVTARRREELLQEVPVAVSALDWERLEDTGAKDLTALQQQTPNATVQVARGSSSTLISFIRGVGQQDPLWGFEPGVGLYVDDVYIARPQGAVLDVYDIERIEVLRGPQGTLYGRNTIGGAIKYVSRRLGSTPRFEGKLSAGSYGQLDAVGSFAVPLSDTLSIGGAIARFTRDGYGKNLTTGAEHYNRDTTAFRFSAEFTPTDSLFIRLAYDQLDDDSNARHGHRLVAGAMPGSDILPNVYDTRAGAGDDNLVKTKGLSLSIDWTLNDTVTLRSITARREGETPDTIIDFDSTPTNTLDIPGYYADEQFTQEFQMLYEGERVQGVAGVYYLDARAEGGFDTILGLGGFAIGTVGYTETKSWALFGDASIDINDKTRFSLGARYTRDERTGHVHRATFLGARRTPLLGGAAATPFLVNTLYTNTRDFSQFTPRISLSRDFSDALTGYASYSQGFKSGGFDMRGDAIALPSTVDGYDPEKVKTYELGLKGSALAGRLNFSSALFYSDYTNQQVTIQAWVPATNTVASLVDNAGSSTIYGAEFEVTANLSKSFRVFASLGYVHAGFDEFITYNAVSGSNVDISSTAVFQNTPKFTGYLGATWSVPAFGGTLALTPSLSHRSSYHMFETPNAMLDENGYTLVDVNAVWTSANSKWSVGLAGRNLSDETYRIGGYVFPGALFDNSIVAFYGPPRTWTATFTYRY